MNYYIASGCIPDNSDIVDSRGYGIDLESMLLPTDNIVWYVYIPHLHTYCTWIDDLEYIINIVDCVAKLEKNVTSTGCFTRKCHTLEA